MADQGARGAGAEILDALGIDPETGQAKFPDPPHDPPGPIVIAVEAWQPLSSDFVSRVSDIVGADIVELVAEDDPSRLPSVCFGVIGMEMWSLQLACVVRGLEVRMFETMKSLSIDDSNGIDRSWPGYKLLGYDEDWQDLVDEGARSIAHARDVFTQRDVKLMRSPSDAGLPLVWKRRFTGQSGCAYEFQKVLGLGGTAIVALVTSHNGTQLAAKAPSAHRLPVEGRLDRFEREGRILAEIDHPHVIKAVDFATMDGDVPVIVLEYLAGGSLYEVLNRGPRPEPATAVRWLRETLMGLEAMHDKGIVHRDISTKNLMFRSPGHLVVSDFGTARHLDDATLTAQADRIGSLLYMAPEQFDSAHDVKLAADIYSVGQVGFELLTGARPFGNTGALAERDDIPLELSRAIDAMRAYEPGVRPVDATAALKILDEAFPG